MALQVSNKILYICMYIYIYMYEYDDDLNITNIEIHKENVSCLEYYIGCCIRTPDVYSSKFMTHICITRRKKHAQRLVCVAEYSLPAVLSHGASSALN
jgi:hypothetical protein